MNMPEIYLSDKLLFTFTPHCTLYSLITNTNNFEQRKLKNYKYLNSLGSVIHVVLKTEHS